MHMVVEDWWNVLLRYLPKQQHRHKGWFALNIRHKAALLIFPQYGLPPPYLQLHQDV